MGVCLSIRPSRPFPEPLSHGSCLLSSSLSLLLPDLSLWSEEEDLVLGVSLDLLLPSSFLSVDLDLLLDSDFLDVSGCEVSALLPPLLASGLQTVFEWVFFPASFSCCWRAEGLSVSAAPHEVWVWSVHLTVSILLLGLLPPKIAGFTLACLGISITACWLGEDDKAAFASGALDGLVVVVAVAFLG